jgi:cell division protein FtsB
MKKFAKLLPWLKNKYVITVIAFIVWMTFFDRNDFISQYSYRKQLGKLQNDKNYYASEIDLNKKNTFELKSNSANLEKFAREKYLMKKDNEEIFLIVRK